jgi:hypothetical protein
VMLQQASADRWSFEDLYYVVAFVLLVAGIAGAIWLIRAIDHRKWTWPFHPKGKPPRRLS